MKLRICISFASAFSVQLQLFHQLVDDGKKEKKKKKREKKTYICLLEQILF